MAHAFVYSVPIPSKRGRNRALYMTQIGVMPPSFAVFVKERGDVPESFTRYLLNKIRSHFGFNGSPIRIVYREK
jgi:GTP-binding protein